MEPIPNIEKEPGKLMNILAVDDDASIRMIAPLLIEGSNVASQVGLIDTAADGQEAFERIMKENKYNLVLTDGSMPRMNGLELAKRIKASGKNIVVGLVSGGIGDLDLSIASVRERLREEFGISGVLQKPYTRSEFSGFMDEMKVAVDLRATAQGKAGSVPPTPPTSLTP